MLDCSFLSKGVVPDFDNDDVGGAVLTIECGPDTEGKLAAPSVVGFTILMLEEVVFEDKFCAKNGCDIGPTTLDFEEPVPLGGADRSAALRLRI